MLSFVPLSAALLALLALSWGAVASGAGALLLTAGPAVLIALLVSVLVRAAAWRLLGEWAWFPWWWVWVPAAGAGAGVALWWRRTGQTVDGLRAATLEAQRASVAFAAGLVVGGHPAPLDVGGYLLGTLPLALVVGTLGVAGWDTWCRLDARMDQRRLVAEQRAADARQQEQHRQEEDTRRRVDEQRRLEVLRRQQTHPRPPHQEPQRVPVAVAQRGAEAGERSSGGRYSDQRDGGTRPPTHDAQMPRDAAVFRDLARHRVLSIPWLCRVHFAGREPATAERLRKLTRAGYVEHLATLRGEREGYRLTGKGRRHLGVSTRPTPRDGTTEWHALHAMTTAEIALAVTRKPLEGSGWTLTWLTEQELVDGLAPWLPLADHGRGFVPDGVMVFTHDTADDERRVAVEVELHEKTPGRYVKKLAWYRSLLQRGVLSRVRWYVPSDRVGDAVGRALAAAGLPEDGPLIVEVKRIEEGIPVYGKAHLTRVA